jgi:hypothetical protein
MSRLVSIFVGLLTAVAAGLEAGFVADLCVGWYRVSSFAGASGYFVFIGLFGAVGLAMGIVCSIWSRPFSSGGLHRRWDRPPSSLSWSVRSAGSAPI